MDGLRDYHTTSEREKQIYGITHIYNLFLNIFLKNNTNDLIYKTEIDL